MGMATCAGEDDDAPEPRRFREFNSLWQVRGTPYNNGCGIHMAVAVGAALAGDFSSSGCHSTCWDAIPQILATEI